MPANKFYQGGRTKIPTAPRPHWIFCCVLLPLLFSACAHPQPAAHDGPVRVDFAQLPFPKLSDYHFFKGDMTAMVPNDRVLPYELITPLFTDYAHKTRFVWIPEGTAPARVDAQGRIEFPDEAVLIKNFYYPRDFREPDGHRDMVETRLLVKNKGEWKAYTYVWNEGDTDAEFTQVGDIKEVGWKDEKGLARQVSYVVPNKNQCKSCHNRENTVQPIGSQVRNLNQSITYPDGLARNQIAYLQEAGYLEAGDFQKTIAPVADWDDPHSGDLNARALAYLDVNCGHCHNPSGPAHTTGLYLGALQKDPALLGVHKPPVAAGRGSGNRAFGIVPGQPEGSILLYRMESDDPGIMMPELGRAVAHDEAVALIREWIAKMPEKGF